jgi:CDP-paratose 2-epimerase
MSLQVVYRFFGEAFVSIALITGSAGLIGSEAVRFFAQQGLDVVGVDNDMRGYFFGAEASTQWNLEQLKQAIPSYRHYSVDIRDKDALNLIFELYGAHIAVVIHTAAQPSHDWAAREPITDFTVNAVGTLNLLELTRQYCPEAAFIFTSTNKVYGDTPNRLPLVALENRYELASNHPYFQYGIDEQMSIDHSMHSLFGASKAAADLLVQEYGQYFGMKTACFRGGCLTGPAHSGTELHGFLAYLVKCVLTDTPYTIFGYDGKQVRDNIHAHDLVNAFWHFFQAPRAGEVYNIGGSRYSNCSMREAIAIAERLSGKSLAWSYAEANRMGDHMWWVSDIRKFESHYPQWKLAYSIERIIGEIVDAVSDRLRVTSVAAV